MMHICNSSFGEAEAGGPQVEGQSGRPSESIMKVIELGMKIKMKEMGADLWMGREGRREAESEEETMTG